MIITMPPVQEPGTPTSGLLPEVGGSAWGTSVLTRFRRCKRLYAFHSRGWRNGAARRVLSLGKIAHQGVAHHHVFEAIARAGKVQACGREYTSTAGLLPPEEAVRVSAADANVPKETASTALAAFQGYMQWWAALPKPRPLAVGVEFPITLDVGAPVKLTSVLDNVFKVNGLYQIWDSKTASSFHEGTFGDYDMRLQVHAYDAWGIETLGAAYGGSVVVFLESVLPYRTMARPVRITPDMRSNTRVAIRDTLMDILDAEGRYGADPWAWPARFSGGDGEGCVNKFGRCEFYDVCKSGRISVAAGMAAPAGWKG